MPYIKNEDRVHFDGLLNEFDDQCVDNPGHLNYLITRMCDEYIKNSHQGLSYSTINEVIGVLECAKLEFYRRIASPYEDNKKYENGDVY